MLQQRQQGFAVLEAVLILVVIAIISGTGWYVWHSRQETSKALDSSQNASDSTPKTSKITNFDECVAAGNPVMESYPEQCAAQGKTFVNTDQKASNSDWTTYTSSKYNYTLRYPKNWYRSSYASSDANQCDESSINYTLQLGVDKASSGLCAASEALAQISVNVFESNTQGFYLTDDMYNNVTEKKVVIDGKEGSRQSGITSTKGEFDPPKGTQVVQYIVRFDGKLFVARYTQPPNTKNVIDEFDTMMTQTLEFE